MGYFGYYYYDEPWVILLLLASMGFALWAQFKVKSTFSKYEKVINRRGITGAEAAEMTLRYAGIRDVRVTRVAGRLTDHFDPRKNEVFLSDAVYSSKSTSAIGVACHEVGHAIQFSEGYSPMKLRHALVPISNIGSNAAFPLIILGLVFSMTPIINIGIILFSTIALFQLVTLPVEYDASRRAIASLEQSMILSEDEIKGAKKTLNAAALTYVAALAVSLANLIRIIVRYGGRSRD